MTFGLIFLVIGVLLAISAWIWLIVVAFKNNERNWGIVLIVSLLLSVFLPITPLAALVFIILKWGIARRPGLLYVVSLVFTIVGTVITALGAKELAAKFAQQAADQAAAEVALTSTPSLPTPTIPPAPERQPDPAPTTTRPPPTAPARTIAGPERPPRTPPAIPTPEPVPVPAPNPAPNSGSNPASEPPVATATTPPALDSRVAPVKVDLVELGEGGPGQIRTIGVRARNASSKPIRELKLQLAYFDARGLRLGRWTTVHSSNDALVAGGSTNEFQLQAFFVPQFTRDVKIDVEAVAFTDGSRWPQVDRSLIRPAPIP